jgi:hypothetical protein
MRFTKLSALEAAANVAVVVLCAVAVTQVAWHQPRRTETPGAGPVGDSVLRSRYSVGQQAPLVPNTAYADAECTVLLALKSTCRYCSDSMAFYGRLQHRIQDAHGHLVVLWQDTAGLARDYLQGHRLSVDSVVLVSFARLGIPGTPTLMLVDPAGMVRGVWIGYLAEAEQNEVLSAVARVSSSTEHRSSK